MQPFALFFNYPFISIVTSGKATENEVVLFCFIVIVNSQEYLSKEESQVPVDEVFFYRSVQAS